MRNTLPSSAAPDIRVRTISTEDARAVAELSHQLGYEASLEAVAAHIARLSSSGTQVAFVACLEGNVIGWIEAEVMHHLQSEHYVLISGLVVHEEKRGLGIGKQLCAEVERWSKEQGLTAIRVTSRISRGDAHRFYLREGFQRIKTWAVFEKMLS